MGKPTGNIVDGDLLENYIIDASDNAATNLKWNSTTEQKYTVPAGKFWMLYGGQVQRDVQTGTATLLVTIDNESDVAVLQLDTQANGVTLAPYPNASSTAGIVFPIKMDAGWYVHITVGEAQDTGAWATCMVIEHTA